jgi:hypothetical protein
MKLENACHQALTGPGREDLNIVHGRRPNRKARRAAATNRPTFMMMFKLEEPGMLTGAESHDWPASRIVIKPLSMTGVEVGKNYTVQFRHGGGDTKTFSRMIAKIAHAYAVDAVGLNGFTALTTNLIRNMAPLQTSALVGASATVEPSSTEPGDRHTLRHEWGIAHDGSEVLLVKIRLFGDLGMPTYVVVTGRRPQ